MDRISRSRTEDFFLLLMIGVLNTITPFSIDMYLPAFPQIASDLHTTVGEVALSVSTYFLGFAVGQLLYGPLLDRYGRKPPLYAGLSLYILATACCALAPGIEMLWVLRFMQALSGCVASVAAMAMVRDFYPVHKSAQIISLLILILGLSPLLAPSVGSFIIAAYNWHFVFAMLAGIAFIMLLLSIFVLPEGHIPDKSISLKPRHILTGFKNILFTPQFYVFTVSGSISFSGLFVYVAGSPALFMDYFHLSGKVYGGIFAMLSVGFIGGSQLNHILVNRYGNLRIFKTTLVFQVIAGALFLLCSLQAWCSLWMVLVFLFVFLACAGISFPNAAAVALAPFAKNAGSASALLGFIQIGIGGCISSAVGLVHLKGSLTMAVVMAVASVTGLIILSASKVHVKQNHHAVAVGVH
jgi:DHA1 family bicyclomycin/chloramphenicol resistance-like MFS transporter